MQCGSLCIRLTATMLRILIGGLALMVLSVGVPTDAVAQYRPGDFVNGQPVFRMRKSTRPVVRSSTSRLRRSRPARRRVVRRQVGSTVKRVPRQRTVTFQRAYRQKSSQPQKREQRASARAVSSSGPALETARVQEPVVRQVSVAAPASKGDVRPPIPGMLDRVAFLGAPRPETADPRAGNSSEGLPPSWAEPPRVPLPARHIPKPKPRKVMQIVVSLDRQNLTVYQDDKPISRSAVSTGQRGHRTPTGIFSIIQKNRFHRSNIYSGAPMPFMQRITWSGIALHLGRLPGYPASHGCIRLPGHFAVKLFKATKMRTHVIVADGSPVPVRFAHPNLPGRSDLADQKLAILSAGLPPAAHQDARDVRTLLTQVNWRGSVTTIVRDAGMDDLAALEQPGVRLSQLAAILHWDQTEQLAHRFMVVRGRSEAPLRILVTRRTEQDRTRGIQRQLLSLGYDVGDVDGRIGSQTIAVTKAFQDTHGLRRTGVPDDATRSLLNRLTGTEPFGDGMVYVRQDGKDIYSGPIILKQPDVPLGTHLYTMADLDEGGEGRWLAMTLETRGRLPGWSKSRWRKQSKELEPVDFRQAIGRIEFPLDVRQTIEDRLTPGSSLIIADGGSERETGLSTDFIVLTE